MQELLKAIRKQNKTSNIYLFYYCFILKNNILKKYNFAISLLLNFMKFYKILTNIFIKSLS